VRKQYIIAAIVLLVLWAGQRLASVEMADGLFAVMKPALVPIANIYLGLFNTPATAVILSSVLLIASVVLSIWFAVAVRPRLSAVTALAFNLRNSAARSPPGSALLNEIDSELGKPSDVTFAEEWKLFKASIIEPAAGQGGRPCCVVRPEMYFNLRALERKGLPITTFLSLPKFFVGIGLVFTFMGLVAGLYLATRGLRAGGFEEARASLIQLLNASTFKFLTSIAGIGGSLIVSFVVQGAVTRLAIGVDDFCHAVELCVPFRPREVIVAEIEGTRQGQGLAAQ